mmetsp:Transcript_47333/g.131627  ORF Transcript_47333/g.131627 Transcript_47333/m.131627 type:complete len:279 (+) Transcript_47333:348-1184(+)
MSVQGRAWSACRYSSPRAHAAGQPLRNFRPRGAAHPHVRGQRARTKTQASHLSRRSAHDSAALSPVTARTVIRTLRSHSRWSSQIRPDTSSDTESSWSLISSTREESPMRGSTTWSGSALCAYLYTASAVEFTYSEPLLFGFVGATCTKCIAGCVAKTKSWSPPHRASSMFRRVPTMSHIFVGTSHAPRTTAMNPNRAARFRRTFEAGSRSSLPTSALARGGPKARNRRSSKSITKDSAAAFRTMASRFAVHASQTLPRTSSSAATAKRTSTSASRPA